jgi:fructuronate reductase
MGMITALLYYRYQSGQYPLAMVSFDNCSHNGDKLYEAVISFAHMWSKNGLADEGFVSYLQNREKVTFPWTMIDKITPRPDKEIGKLLQTNGLEDVDILVTGRGSYMAPFVNAEESETLVIEDAFPGGRPPLELCGVIFTDRETVDKVEKMKVCTCLNPLHTALSVFGCLLGFNRISEMVKDKDLLRLICKIGYTEGLPVVTDPEIINPKTFLDEVINVRLPNPFIPDSPQRIATDTSKKLPIRFGETLKGYIMSDDLDSAGLIGIPLVFAGWLRYLLAVDDNGQEFTLSSDPILDLVCEMMRKISLGKSDGAAAILRPILQDKHIFGVNLDEAGLCEKVLLYFNEMNEGPGAVRRTLKKYLG